MSHRGPDLDETAKVGEALPRLGSSVARECQNNLHPFALCGIEEMLAQIHTLCVENAALRDPGSSCSFGLPSILDQDVRVSTQVPRHVDCRNADRSGQLDQYPLSLLELGNLCHRVVCGRQLSWNQRGSLKIETSWYHGDTGGSCPSVRAE